MTGKVVVEKEAAAAKPTATPTQQAVAATTHATSIPVAGGKVQPKPTRLPRTGEDAPDMRGYILLATLLILAAGIGLRYTLAHVRR